MLAELTDGPFFCLFFFNRGKLVYVNPIKTLLDLQLGQVNTHKHTFNMNWSFDHFFIFNLETLRMFQLLDEKMRN